MSSDTALLAFAVFIAAGFFIEARGRVAPVTAATWLPVVWMAVCASRSIGQWLSVSNYKVTYSSDTEYIQASTSGSPIDRLVLTLMIVVGIVVIHRRGAIGHLIRTNKWLLVFVLYLGLTALWSDTPALSFKRWIRLFGHVVMAGVVLSEPFPLEALRTVFRRCAYLLLPLSVMLIKYFPNIGVLYFRKGELLWIGAAVMKNGLGHLALVFTFVVIWELVTFRNRGERPRVYKVVYDVIVLTMGLWLLRGPDGANSSAAIGSLIVGLVLVLGSRLPAMHFVFARSGVLVIVSGVLFVFLQSAFGIVEMIVTALGRDMTFTDRVPLWNVLVELGLRSPVFGYGYSGFWTPDRVVAVAAVAGEFNQGHNGYLELFVEGGFVAIGLLLFTLVTVIRKIQQTAPADFDFGVLRLCFLAIVLIGNVTESSFARERDLLTIVFFMIAVNDARQQLSAKQVAVAATTNDLGLASARKVIRPWQTHPSSAGRR